MFAPIHQLRMLDEKEAGPLQDRWSGPEGPGVHEKVVEQIKKGAGERFLENATSFLVPGDLRGITLKDLVVEFPEGGGFSGIDFSYASFDNCVLGNAKFRARFRFATFKGCRFVNCTFHACAWTGARFVGCSFEDCAFVDGSLFTNCQFSSTKFQQLTTDGLLFEDCSMDSTCVVAAPKLRAGAKAEPEAGLAAELLSDFYASVSRAYGVGGVGDRKRDYFLKASEARTKYQCKGPCKIIRWIAGGLTGYGVRPARPAGAALLTALVFAAIFARLTSDIYGGFVLSFAGLFTMVSIGGIPFPYDWLFIAEGLTGMAFFGLYIASLANVWFDR